MHKKILTIVGITILFLGISITPTVANSILEQSSMTISNGNTLYVGGSGEGNYTSIQDAIDNSSDGDTVFVFNGIYNEGDIHIYKSITLTGEDKYKTIIACDYEHTIIFIYADLVNINGFTINNSGIGIYAETNNSNISNNIITELRIDGIHLVDSSNVIISKNIITNNLYCGILLGYSSDNLIYENEINNNGLIGNDNGSADFDSGIFLALSHKNNIFKNNISNNYKHGINVSFLSHFNLIHHNNFIDNCINAGFSFSYVNSWQYNYWDDWIGFGPRLIFGFLGPFRNIPWIDIDRRPAKEPYDI
jgi:parallel beta-helix repeat protein